MFTSKQLQAVLDGRWGPERVQFSRVPLEIVLLLLDAVDTEPIAGTDLRHVDYAIVTEYHKLPH